MSQIRAARPPIGPKRMDSSYLVNESKARHVAPRGRRLGLIAAAASRCRRLGLIAADAAAAAASG
jgi:hypothetical protein